jgi:hypothetical protein
MEQVHTSKPSKRRRKLKSDSRRKKSGYGQLRLFEMSSDGQIVYPQWK